MLIIHLAAKPPRRRGPLSSNVRRLGHSAGGVLEACAHEPHKGPRRGRAGVKFGRTAEVKSSARAEARAGANVSQSVGASPALCPWPSRLVRAVERLQP